MLRNRFLFGLSVLFLSGGIVVSTQGHGNSPKSTPAPAPKASAAPHTTAPVSAKAAPATTQSAHATAAAKAQPAKGAATKSAAATTTTKASPSTAHKTDKPAATTAKSAAKPVKTDKPADTKVAKADKPAKSPKSTTTASTSTSSDKKTTSTTTGTPTTELTAVQQKLKQNTNLAAKVASRLPAGTDVIAAAAGFKNLGQFVAAANVSNNLQISFADLKAKMVTGGMSLGQAIQAVRPLTASPTIEVQRAEYDARGMIAESEQPTTPPSTTGGPVTTATTPTAAPTTASSTTVKSKVKAKKPVQ